MSELTVKKVNSADTAQLIPFEITAQQASQLFARYIARNKLNPTEIFEAARNGKIEAVYFPAYAFDCSVTTSITAACAKDEDTSFRFTAYRELESEFSEIVIPSGDKVDTTLFSLLEPYNLQSLKDFDSTLTENAEIQQSAVSAEEIFEQIEPQLRQEAFYQTKNTISEYTEETVTENSHTFNRVTATHILLPMWVLNCEYKGQPCRLFMNGQTGKIAGVPPRSKNKTLALLGAGAAAGAVLGQLIWMAVKTLW